MYWVEVTHDNRFSGNIWSLFRGKLKNILKKKSMGRENESLFGGLGHMTKKAATRICGKKLLKSSSLEPKGQWPWGLVCNIRDLGPTKFVQMMILGWPWLFCGKVKYASLCFYMGKYIFLQEQFKKVILWKKLTTNDQSDKKFLLSVDIKVLSPRGCLLLPGALYVYKSMKKKICIKSSKRFFEMQSDKVLLLTSKLCP